MKIEDNKDNIRDIVVSCRVRLARNQEGMPFVHKLDNIGAIKIIENVFKAGSNLVGNYDLYKMSTMSDVDAKVLQEKRMISEDLIRNKSKSGVIIDRDNQVSIMINEEDHVRIQCMYDGLELGKAFKRAFDVESKLAKNIKFAYDQKLGYLTSCVTNLGTGMRCGALLFLPGLAIANSIEKNIRLVAANFKIAIRGHYGEGSNNEGYFYQISNERTFGQRESDILQAVVSTINQLVKAEQSARQILLAQNNSLLKDKIGRAFGILTNAHMLTSKEFMELIALVKLGVSLKVLNLKESNNIDDLIIACQPANIMSICGEKVTPIERDEYRAKLVASTIHRAF